MKSYLFLLIIFKSILFMSNSCVSDHADHIYINGHFYTLDETNPVVQAVAVSKGRIIFAGDNEGAMQYSGRNTKVTDLEEQVVIPGLTESHMHFDNLGRNLLKAPLDVYWLQLDDLKTRISKAVEKAKQGEWILARGYNEALWDELPHRGILDAISPDNPLVLRRYCGHAHWVNSRALELSGVTADTPSPPAGLIMKDATGEPTGVLVSAAGALVTSNIPPAPPLTLDEELEAMRLGSDTLLTSGITTVHCATPTGEEDVLLRRKAYERGLLKVRVMDAVEAETAIAMGKPLINLYNDHYTVRWVKMFIDGSLGGRGAALTKQYSDMPGEYGSLRELGQDEEKYAQLVADLLEMGFTTRTHSIGDRGNHITLNAFERAMELSGKKPGEARLVVEHAQVLLEDDIRRFANRNILASMQPVHATEDMLFVEDRIGTERAKHAYAWRSIIDQGGIIAGGSDYWVSPFNPFYGMHAAVTRQDRANNPPGGWFHEQAMTRKEALKAYTLWPAYLEFSENKKGSITPGKLADFVVIDRDYFEIPAEDIHKIQVLRTVIGGETVFVNNNPKP